MNSILTLRMRYCCCVLAGALFSYFALAAVMARLSEIRLPLPAADGYFLFINSGVFIGLPVLSFLVYTWSKTMAGIGVAVLFAVFWLAALAILAYLILRSLKG